MSGGTKIIPIIIALALFVLTVYLINWRESNGEVANTPSYVEHDLPYLVSVKSPPGREEVFAEIMTVTAYSKAETCPDRECITSSGKVASKGLVACPRAFQHGTRIGIKGKEYECAERTAKRFDGRIDILMDSYQEALAFGRQKLEVIIK